jgi:FlaG/FlaF family flagellin (archaellin)
MKSLIQTVALAVVLAAPVASFAQPAGEPASQDSQAMHTQAARPHHAARTDDSGYGASSHGTWQAGSSTDTTVSSYSPPIYNAR